MHRNIVAMTDTIRYNGPKFAMVPEWLLFDPNVSMAAKTVYAALARHGSTEETCFPSVSRIAALLGSTPKTVRRLIDELVESGAVERHKRFRADGGATSNGYTIWGTESAPQGYGSRAETSLTPGTKTTHPPGVEMSPPLGHFDPRPLGQKRPTKESQSKESQLTRKHTCVVSAGNIQPVLLDVDGLPPAVSIPDRFEEWWRSYPRKVGKPKALAAWGRKIKTNDLQTVIEGTRLWVEYYSAEKTEPQFIPHPTTFLNEERFRDTPPARKTVARDAIVERTGQTMNMRMVGGKLVPA